MIRYEDECVGCPPELGCLGESCPYKRVPHMYCDRCGEEVDTLYKDQYGEYCLCRECFYETVDKLTLEQIEWL